MPLEPLICRSRYGNVKKSYKNRRKFGESEKSHTFVVLKETKVLTVPCGTIKNINYEKMTGTQHLNVHLKYYIQAITTIFAQHGLQR